MRIPFRPIFLFLSILLLVSIVYSKFLLSVSTILLFALSLVKILPNHLGSTFKAYTRFVPLFALSFFLWMVIVSGINSSFVPEWLHQVKMKLPYLVLPFSLWVFKDEVVKYYRFFHQLFISIIFFSSFFVLYAIFKDYDSVVLMLNKGQSVSTPVDHIKYSIFVCFSVMSCFVLAFAEREKGTIELPSWLYLIVGAHLFLLLHLMAVRSGLVLCYIILTLAIFNQIRLSKKYVLAIPTLVLIMCLPLSAYKFIPSVKAKIDYMRFDISKFKRGEGNSYSDSERLHSILVGMDLFKKQPIMGTGIGDLRIESGNLMGSRLGKKSDKYPHNQFVFTLAGMGIIGLGFLLFAFFCAWSLFPQKEWLFVFLAILLLISFLVENTLERSYSIAFFCFFYGSGIIRSHDKRNKLA